jgi:riboflavin transporter
MKNVSKSTNLTIKLGLLGAIALLLSYLAFPVLPAFSFLKIDLSDIPALIGAFAFGPLAGAIIEALKNILVFIFNSSGTGGIGELANFMVGCFYVCTAGFIYSKNRTRKTAMISLILATVVMSVAGVLANYFIFVPMYYGNKSIAFIFHYLVFGIVPFNLIKGIIVSAVTMLIYKRVSMLIHSEASKYWNTNNKRKSA